MRWTAVLLVLASCDSVKSPPKKRRPDLVMIDAVRAALDRHVVEHGAFPAATVDKVPPDGCCAQGFDRLCTPATFADVAWVDPTKVPPKISVQLSYHSDGKTVSVHAFGDADCDNTLTDTELSGSIDGKKAIWTVEENATQD
jgi:hypothetical protein